MDEKITYGVFWRSTLYGDTEIWMPFFNWFKDYSVALNEANEVRKNPACLAVKIVERVETFEDVPGTAWERSNHD